MREIREGIDDTGVKAAFLKCAVEQHGLIGDVPRILEAVAAASVETGAPVMVHTNAPAQTGLMALEALTSAGVDPRRIVIAHAGDSNDLDYLRAIARHGREPRLRSLQDRALQPGRESHRTLVALLAEGYTQQHPSRPRRRLLLRLHDRQPVLRRREAGLPAHLAARSCPRCSPPA